jgi:hypothetical protein
MEDMAAWVLIAAGLLVLLLSYGVGAQFCNQGLERVQWRARSAPRPRPGSSPTLN